MTTVYDRAAEEEAKGKKGKKGKVVEVEPVTAAEVEPHGHMMAEIMAPVLAAGAPLPAEESTLYKYFKADIKPAVAEPAAERIMLTKELAQYLLDHNYGSEHHHEALEFTGDTNGTDGIKRNRNISNEHAERISRVIDKGHWEYNADPIRISKNGWMIDGQHRAAAEVLSGKPIDTLIVYGFDDRVIEVIDHVRPRTYSNTLFIRGIENSQRTASIAGLIWCIESDDWSAKGRADYFELDAVAKKYEASIAWAIENIPRKIQNPAVLAGGREIIGSWAFMHAVCEGNPTKLAKLEKLAKRYADGTNISEGDPMGALRQLMGASGVFSRKRITIREKVLRVLRCIEAGIKGESYAQSRLDEGTLKRVLAMHPNPPVQKHQQLELEAGE